MAKSPVRTEATSKTAEGVVKVQVKLSNAGAVASLANKLTLVEGPDQKRILPAYFSDNYVSLLPGETRTVEIEYSAEGHPGPAAVMMRGWNADPQTVPVAGAK